MRVAIDAMLLGPRESGVERCIRGLIEALARLGADHEYVVYHPAGAPPLDIPSGARVQIVAVAVRSRWSRIAWEQFALPRLLRRGEADVLHAPGYVMPLRAPTATVLTVHDVIALKFPRLASRANALHYRFMLPASLRRAARIIASSETTRRDILDIVPERADAIEVIPPGLDPLYFQPIEPARVREVKARYALPERFLLFVGNLEPKKNLPALFDAARRLAARGLRIPLAVVGGKAWRRRAALKGLERLEPGRDVLLLGPAPQADMPALYAAASVFVFPSLYEGFGLPPLEAMACGTPVVASDAPALRETLTGAARLVPATDADALAHAIADALTDEATTRRLAAAGRERAAEFTWDAAARRIARAYERAAGAR